MVTLGESWFCLNVGHELIWLQPNEEIPEREQHTIESEKVMITILWSPSGFHLIKLLLKGVKLNAGDYVAQILDPLSVWRRIQIGRTNRKLIMHADNAGPPIAKVTLDLMRCNARKKAPHPPYSPYLAPSDFCLFGHARPLQRGYEFVDREGLLHAINDILRGSEK
jgi:histone-lysine N-methyltransferase SETMAR